MSGGNVNHSFTRTLAIDALATLSEIFKTEGASRGSVQWPATISSTSFSLVVSVDGVTFTQLQDALGVTIGNTPITAGEAAPLPADLFKFPYAKISTNGAAEAAARVLSLYLAT